MAKYFASHGWNDITIGFPYNPLESNAIEELAGKINLNVIVDNHSSLTLLKTEVAKPLNYFVEIDVGDERSGTDQVREIKKLVEMQNDRISFKGLLSHAGHTYQAKGSDDIVKIHKLSMDIYHKLEDKLKASYFFSYGDTPSFSVCEDFEGVNEIRCGNCIFYDIMQKYIGSCTVNDISVVMACPVVSIQSQRNEAVIYGGAVHFSKESILNENGVKGRKQKFKQC